MHRYEEALWTMVAIPEACLSTQIKLEIADL